MKNQEPTETKAQKAPDPRRSLEEFDANRKSREGKNERRSQENN